MSSKAYC